MCDQALAIIKQVRFNGIKVEEIEIAENEELLKCYGLRIPVVQMTSSRRELAWPFDLDRFQTWLREEITED